MQLTPYPKPSEIAEQTISPLTPGAEWLRPADVKSFCGIGRSVLFELIRDGAIKSVVLRRKGASKGCRLISVASLRSCINGMEAK